jgi:D-alanine-D-alanine ligase
MTRVTVLTGGASPEREVAFAGAAQVVGALRGRGYDVLVVDTEEGALSLEAERQWLVPSVGRAPPTPDELKLLEERELGPRLLELPEVMEADVVFLLLHGRSGEGGTMQAMLEAASVPYTGSGPLGSALAMDKDIAKRLFDWARIPTARWQMWPASAHDIDALGLPLVVKPSKVGSTVGLSVVGARAELERAIEIALRYDDEVMLEQFIPGRELTCGVLGDRALAVGEIVPSHDVFDYECKYTPGMSREIFPAGLADGVTQVVRSMALAAHRALKLRDFSRVDFKLAADGTPCCLEANTLPGLTGTSLLPQSAAAVGVSFADLCHAICQATLRRAGRRNKVEASEST